MADQAPPSPSLMDILMARNNMQSQANVSQNTGAAIPAQSGNINVAMPGGPLGPSSLPPTQSIRGINLQQPSAPAALTNVAPDNNQTQLPANEPSHNYNNSEDVAAVQRAAVADQAPPGGYGKSAGIYGLLPPSLQHGTLRSVLGSLGDAFLVGSNRAPEYKPNQQRLAEGNALAGMDMNNPESVQAAVQRLAATGTPDALAMADKVQTQANQAALARQVQEQNNWFRQQTVDNRTDMRLQSIVPTLGGVLSGVKDPATYAAAYDQIARRIQRIDPKSSPEDLGLPPRDAWTPASTAGFGTTGNAQMVSTDKNTGFGVSRANNADTNHARIVAAGVGAQGHIAAAGVSNQRPSSSTFEQQYIAKKQAGQPTTPQEDALWAKLTAVSGRGARAPLIGTTGANGGNIPTFSPAQAHAAAASGQHGQFRGTDGKLYSY